MANSHRGALYGAGPYRSREGLSTRAASNSNEIQVHIDPMHADLDEEITGLHGKIKQLKNVAQEIGSEAKYQNEFISQLAVGGFKCCNTYFSLGEEFHPQLELIIQSLCPDQKQQMTLIKAQAGVKNNMRRLNKSIIQQGSNHVLHVVLFALFCFFLVYLWSKISRR